MTRFLSARTGRERALIAAAALLLPLLIGWQAVWQPMQARLAALDAEIARYDALIHVALMAPDRTDPRPAARRAGPLARRVTQSAAEAGVTLGRLEPDGPRIEVALPQAGFDDALAWIARLEADHGLTATRIDMARLAAPGTISLTMTLEDAP